MYLIKLVPIKSKPSPKFQECLKLEDLNMPPACLISMKKAYVYSSLFSDSKSHEL